MNRSIYKKMLMDELCHYENEYLAQHGGIFV